MNFSRVEKKTRFIGASTRGKKELKIASKIDLKDHFPKFTIKMPKKKLIGF